MTSAVGTEAVDRGTGPTQVDGGTDVGGVHPHQRHGRGHVARTVGGSSGAAASASVARAASSPRELALLEETSVVVATDRRRRQGRPAAAPRRATTCSRWGRPPARSPAPCRGPPGPAPPSARPPGRGRRRCRARRRRRPSASRRRLQRDRPLEASSRSCPEPREGDAVGRPGAHRMSSETPPGRSTRGVRAARRRRTSPRGCRTPTCPGTSDGDAVPALDPVAVGRRPVVAGSGRSATGSARRGRRRPRPAPITAAGTPTARPPPRPHRPGGAPPAAGPGPAPPSASLDRRRAPPRAVRAAPRSAATRGHSSASPIVVAQRGQPARDPRAHRPLADTGQVGDLGVLQLLVVAQHDRGALGLGQGPAGQPEPARWSAAAPPGPATAGRAPRPPATRAAGTCATTRCAR